MERGKGRDRDREREREVVSVCLHAFRVRIAREQGTGEECKRRGEERVEGLCLVTLLGGEKEGCKRRGERED